VAVSQHSAILSRLAAPEQICEGQAQTQGRASNWKMAVRQEDSAGDPAGDSAEGKVVLPSRMGLMISIGGG